MNRPDAIVTEDLLAAFGLIPQALPLFLAEVHINDTFRVGTKTLIICCSVSINIFSRALKNHGYMCAVTDFIKDKVSKAGGNPDRETLQITKPHDGKTLLHR